MRNHKPFYRLRQEWLDACDALFATLEAVPPDGRDLPGVCGEWNVRQIVAHLAGWHYEAVRRFSAFTAGDWRDKTYDEDAFNAAQVEARAHLDWDLTVADLKEVADILFQLARDITEQRAAGEPRYGEWLVGLTGDMLEHRQQIAAAFAVNAG